MWGIVLFAPSQYAPRDVKNNFLGPDSFGQLLCKMLSAFSFKIYLSDEVKLK